jgi:serine/threonine protein kinase
MKTVEDKYQIKEKLLGQGTFAKTYVAINIKTKQILACKMISKQELLDLINAYKAKNSAKNYFIKALKNEMTTCKKLKHKNIVLCEDVLETKGNIYFFL